MRTIPLLTLAAWLAWAQPAEFLRKGMFEETPAVQLSNDKLSLAILTEGSTFASINLADDPQRLNPLWDPNRMAREIGRPGQAASGGGHFICVDGFGPVSREEFAAGMIGHGEAHSKIFELKSNKEGHTAEVTMKATLPIVQETLTRIIRMVDGENVVYVESELESLLGFDRPINWAEHATVGSPFLEPGVTVFDVSGTRSQTRPYPQLRADPASPRAFNQRRLPSGVDFTWPNAPAADGKPVDMRLTPGTFPILDHTATLFDPARELAWVTALNPKRKLIIGYMFRREDYPWLQTWGNYPLTGKLSRGMEFGTQPYDVSRREAVTMGKLFDTPTYRWLPAKSKLQTRFLMFYARVPEGMIKIDDVQLKDGQITIEDKKAGKKVTLAASRGL